MTDIGVGPGKLYLCCGRERIFPRHRFPWRLKRQFTRCFVDHDLPWRARAIGREILHFDARCWVNHLSRLIERRRGNHHSRFKPRIGMSLISRIDGWPKTERPARAFSGRVGGAHRRDHTVDGLQAGDCDEQSDVRIDAHA